MGGKRIRPQGWGALVAFLVGLACGVGNLEAQAIQGVAVDLPGGAGVTLPLEQHRGYAAFAARGLAPLGWSLEVNRDRGEARLRHSGGITLTFLPNFPYVGWGGELYQLAHAPYWLGENLYLPAQLLAEFFPGLLPNTYSFDAGRSLLTVTGEVTGGDARELAAAGVGGGSAQGGGVMGGGAQNGGAPGGVPSGGVPSGGASGVGGTPSPAGPPRPRILIIDPGHGGSDPGAIGPGGAREADLALAIALALAREFESDPEVEVRLTRDRDVEVPLWSRGEMATSWKGDRPGVFLSIHMNALEDRPGVRGFETYFLSEARDEHERRVAALENASLPEVGGGAADGPDPFLAALLRDLRAFDHQHWSADLADAVQRELGRFHPGSDRGVKQGPFAVITNSIMPSVLVEIGFITSPEEERVLGRLDFQRDAAGALARAVRSFFERYPPGGAP